MGSTLTIMFKLLTLFIAIVSSMILSSRILSNSLSQSQTEPQTEPQTQPQTQPQTLNTPSVMYADLALKLCNGDNEYSIHGFWPEHDEHSWPQWCNTEFKQFKESDVESIKDVLDTHWYACKEWNMTNYDIWYHELNKHGSCIKNETVLHYFKHTLMLYEEAKENGWFGCCKSQSQCLIPFTKDINGTKWLGYCHQSLEKSEQTF